jgi:hypothetical protein
LDILLDCCGADTTSLPPGLHVVEHGFTDGLPCGRLTGPLVLDGIDRPWSGESVQLTIFRPQDDTIIGGVQADDVISLQSAERPYGDCIDMRRKIMLPPGLVHLVLDIAPMRTTQGNRDFDFGQIRTFHLDLGATPDRPVYIRHLRLCNRQDTVGPPATPLAGDTVVLLQHQDISCYTYELAAAPVSPEIGELEGQVQEAIDDLDRSVRLAQLGGKQTLYAEAGRLAAEIALEARRAYPWTRHPAWRNIDLQQALAIARRHRDELDSYARGIVHEDDEDDANIPIPRVPEPVDLATLKIEADAFVDRHGHPRLLYAMNYHNDGPLCRFFAPADHRVESYAVGGGSRYDIEWSPVYRVFKQDPTAARVGYRGWCGHLIKDQWAMGGRKENVVICLENQAVRRAVSQYNREHQHEWHGHPHLLYNILAYELMYMCYCGESVRMFRVWLEEKHGEIGQLNRAWNTHYDAFSAIIPPEAPDGKPADGTNRGLFFDWACWNTHRFTDILRWARDDIRRLDPNIALCAGGTSSMLSPNNANTGIDEERIIAAVDDVILHEGGDLLSLDLLRGLADTPKPVVDPEHGGGAYGMLQGFLHGKSTVAKFWWPKQPSRQFPRSTLISPLQGTVPIDEVAEHLRVALDVRRLGREISSFWNLPTQVALHYSKTNIVQVPFELLGARTTPYLQALRLAYDVGRRLDAPLGFVSEDQLCREPNAAKILILPGAQYMPAAVFTALDTYVRNGGTLVLLPAYPQADEYAQAQDYLRAWGVELGDAFVPPIAGLDPAAQGYDQSFSRNVHFGTGKKLQADHVRQGFFANDTTVETDGIFQEINVATGEVLAACHGTPLLVRRQLGQGALYLFAGTPTQSTLGASLDAIMDLAGVYHPFRLKSPDGARLAQVEARLAHTKFYDLLYLVNETDEAVEFEVEFCRTHARPYQRVRELRSLAYWPQAAGVLAARQTLIFRLEVDPVALADGKEEPLYDYAGI